MNFQVLLSLTLFFLTTIVIEYSSSASAQDKAILPEISIDQDDLTPSANLSFDKIVASGRHLFSTPYNHEDGYGEGVDGPRRKNQELFPHSSFPFLRLNGLDSQSCFECHNSIGSAAPMDSASANSKALARKIGANGGPAGFASNAYINPDFNDKTKPFELVKLIRNPPHVFGTGYVQKLAEEMTYEILYDIKAFQNDLKSRAAADHDATVSGDFHLFAKAEDLERFAPAGEDVEGWGGKNYNINVSLGIYYAEAKWDEEAQAAKIIEESVAIYPPDHKAEVYPNRKAAGVSEDGVVRPLQWKGIASNERNFVKDALNFHFGIQAEELFFEQDPQNTSQVRITEHDNDDDGVRDEISPGNVSALTIFTMSLRPPVQVAHEPSANDMEENRQESAERGRDIFIGANHNVILEGSQKCATCHVPTLSLVSPQVFVLDPTDPENLEEREDPGEAGLSTQVLRSRTLPVQQKFRKQPENQRGSNSQQRIQNLSTQNPTGRAFGFDLNLPLNGQTSNGYATKSLPFSYPRLKPHGHEIRVPLFSDLRRHKMGDKLRDLDKQETDVKGIFVNEDEFLTRPLWGVADSGPWLHDGRALSLKQAILLHESRGSEANDVLESLHRLQSYQGKTGEAATDQALNDLVNFLLTLRLPIEPTLGENGGLPQYQSHEEAIWRALAEPSDNGSEP